MRPTYQVTELLGDGIGPELSRAIHHLAEALPIDLEFVPVDFSLENRRSRGKAIYDEAVETITATRVALKHPTTTAEESPNAILRRRLELSVIHRPVYTIPGVPTNFRRELDLDIVRIATGGTYDDPGRMIGGTARSACESSSAARCARRPATPSTWPARPAKRSPAPRSTRSRRRPTACSSRWRRKSPASSPRSPTPSSSSTHFWARSSWRPRSSRSCWS